VSDPNWSLRQFTPTASVDWAWSITGATPGEHDVSLQLVPAVGDGYQLLWSGSSTEMATYVTHARVQATWLETLDFWWKDNWSTICLIAAAIGAGIISVIKWDGDFIEAIRMSRT